MKIGFCGIGRMGAAMVARLLDQGEKPAIWNRSADKAKPLVERGAQWASSPAKLAAQSDIILSILIDDAAVRQVYEGKDGLFSGDIAGKLFVEMSTVSPALPQALAKTAKAKGAALLECPVGGTVGPAREGKLLGMAGGEVVDFARAKPVLDLLCRRVEHMGPNGAGSAMKLAINLPLSIYWEALGEAISLTRGFAIPPAKMMEVFGESSGGINGLKGRGPAIVAALETGKQPPQGFTIDGVRKDLAIMLDWAKTQGVELPVLKRASECYDRVSRDGLGQGDNCTIVFHRPDQAKRK